MLTQDKPLPQAPQVWGKPTAQANVGDYIRVPFTPIIQVVDKDTLEDGRVWLLVKPTTASHTEEWVLEPELPAETQQLEKEPETECQPQEQPVGRAGDSSSSQLQTAQQAQTKYEQGESHGRHDARTRLHPIYSTPSDAYSAGYLEGYKSVFSPPPQPQAVKQAEWSVVYDPRWQCYQAWVSDYCIGHASTPEEAERLAQKYIATDEMIRRQNLKVLAAYAG